MDSFKIVEEVITTYLEEQELPIVPLQSTTKILDDLAIDSIGLAMIVVQLEEITGRDPFKNGFIRFETVGELAGLYGS